MIDRLQLSGRQQELQQHTQPYRHGYTKRATADNLLTIFEFRRIFPQTFFAEFQLFILTFHRITFFSGKSDFFFSIQNL